MAIIINYDLPDNITVNILPTGETVVNVLPKSPIVVNLCNDNGQSATDYAALTGKPKINDVELIGNKTLTQLGIEPKRGADDFYVTAEEKTQGALATGNAALDTVKKVADYTANLNHKLIASFAPTVGSNIFEIERDNSGVLLSTLNIKKCFISIYCTSSATAIQVGLLRINDVSTSTYKTAGNCQTGLLFRNNAETYQYYNLDFAGIFKCGSSGMNSPTTLNDATGGTILYLTINRTIVDQKLEKLTLILGGGATFGANSIINIWTL